MGKTLKDVGEAIGKLAERFDAMIRDRGNRKDARAYPNYTLKELEKWVENGEVSGDTLEKVKTEIEARKAGKSQAKVTPQAEWGSRGPAMRAAVNRGR